MFKKKVNGSEATGRGDTDTLGDKLTGGAEGCCCHMSRAVGSSESNVSSGTGVALKDWEGDLVPAYDPVSSWPSAGSARLWRSSTALLNG